MPKRTIADARRQLEDLALGLNPAQYQQAEGEINAASAQATELATRYVERQYADTVGSRDQVLADWCELRDNYRALANEVTAGRVSSPDAAKRLGDLQKRHRALERTSVFSVPDRPLTPPSPRSTSNESVSTASSALTGRESAQRTVARQRVIAMVRR